MREQLNFGQVRMRERESAREPTRAIIHSLSYLEPRLELSIWDRTRFPDLQELNFRNEKFFLPRSDVHIGSLNSIFHIFIPPAATDADTRDEEVTFLISGPDCGIVSLTSRPGRPLTRFTQADVRNGRVLFTHTGKTRKKHTKIFGPSESKVVSVTELLIN